MGDAELDEGSVTLPDKMGEDIDLNGGQLRAKLRELRIMRAELDEDINSMERALSIIIGGESL
jgi:hypothetical protein